MRILIQRLAAVVLVLAWAQASSAQTADEVIEKSIAAMGGRAALEKIKTRSMTGSIETHPIQIQDDLDRTMRFIVTQQVPSLDTNDTTVGFGVRDLWAPAPLLKRLRARV